MNASTSTNTSAARQGFYGKYRGTVVNNIDPMQIGRLLVIVPDVGSLVPGTWAMPCVPIAGIATGFFALPLPNSGVWIEFERGDPDHPIWTGCYWGLGAEVPALARLTAPVLPSITLQTPMQHGLTVSDTPGPTGGILMKTASGAFISISDIGIVINNGKGAVITMMSGPTIDINAGALTIT
jgi:hypothetical protein